MVSVKKKHKKHFAQVGLVAKGLIYCLLGLLTFMAGFNINGQSTENADKSGVFDFIYKQWGGQIILAVLVVGLVCYCIWRLLKVFEKQDDGDDKKKIIGKKIYYFFSVSVYGSLAYSIVKKLIYSVSDSGDSKQHLAQTLLNKPFGQVLAILAALIFAGVGIYQFYYSLSEKYKKHVDKQVGNEKGRKAVMAAGKTGYIARGIVWMLIAFLFLKAALNKNSSSAGNSSKAFAFLSEQAYGTYLLAAIGLGLVCYGTFNFIRARYENLI
ncbi:DUF1206 domain-containing protein [Flavobacterium rhizosphaerae]|uniref:DUF1206 domain-containing protein n=1 Tax=Flavobacterium rhizosphaerae TaxID=3163298 RepID=A0ABW8YSP8_9FLAO